MIVKTEDFLAARLPAEEGGFQFDAFLEFKYLSAYWTAEKARVYNDDPVGGHGAVEKDVEKLGRQITSGACRLGYAIISEECDWGFAPTFALDAELDHGCKARFIRGYSHACPNCGSETILPIVWGMPAPELERLEREGKVVLGGCLVEGDGLDPQWHCNGCTHRWRMASAR